MMTTKNFTNFLKTVKCSTFFCMCFKTSGSLWCGCVCLPPFWLWSRTHGRKKRPKLDARSHTWDMFGFATSTQRKRENRVLNFDEPKKEEKNVFQHKTKKKGALDFAIVTLLSSSFPKKQRKTSFQMQRYRKRRDSDVPEKNKKSCVQMRRDRKSRENVVRSPTKKFRCMRFRDQPQTNTRQNHVFKYDETEKDEKMVSLKQKNKRVRCR